MCRRASLRGAVVAFFLAASVMGLAAQQDDATREQQLVEQLTRLQTHQQELREADRALESMLQARRRAAMTVELDTASVGPFLVVALPEQLSDAVEVFTGAWTKLEESVSDWSPTDEDRAFIFHKTNDGYMGGSRRGVQARPWYPRARVEARALAALQKRIFDTGVPLEARSWAAELGLGDRHTLEYAYRNLIITAAESARDCFEGDAERCWDALGLRNVESSWASWYDAAERRAWAAPYALTTGGVDSCENSTGSCLAYLEANTERAPIPVEPLARASFLGHVLRVGGEGALDRLGEGDEDTLLADRLVHASGMSPDDLIVSWRTEVLAAAPASQRGMSLKLLSAGLFWSMVFSGFSLRSTRWRA